MAQHIALVINGPNLNQLGVREPELYGSTSLADIEALCRSAAKPHGMNIEFMQSNDESEIIEAIQSATNRQKDAILINAAAFTHTSVAIRDAMLMFAGIKIEIHLSNIFSRESFRHHSYLSDIVTGVICGFGADSYRLAVEAAASKLQSSA
jgi:3-dehydroquinate dehydratase-2